MVQLATDWRQADITERDFAMLEYAEKMTFDAPGINEGDINKLRSVGFEDGDILSIAVLAAYRNFIDRIADGLGCQLDPDSLGEDQRVIEALTTGKAVDLSS
ncbi:MAG: 4-carboxymuconolactone decarboxylase [Chloroflexi bacterium]|nr:MAG: 4-carboxymuconolactone decarboxylase [Chloroflexota bacterium]